MAIIENRVTEEGDVLVIKPEVPIVGLLSLSQFVDTTTGESETDYFLKQFRYSSNGGVTYSDWIELTLLNISSVVITKYNQFVIEYKYTRVGSTTDLDLEFDDILVSGEIEDLTYPVYQKMFFNRFFNINDVNVFGWALNVLEKLYVKGLILPEYITRGENNSNLEDEDFIVFWGVITHYFAIIVNMARKFEDIENNSELLVSFLSSRGIYYSESLDAEELSNIFSDWIDEYNKRGTSSISVRSSDSVVLNGELIRLLDLEDDEEIIFQNLNNFESGWCIGKSSPCWDKTQFSVNLRRKMNNDTLETFPLVLSSFVSDSVDEEEDVIEIDSTDFAGIGYNGIDDIYYPIMNEVSYEISFFIKFLTSVTELKCLLTTLDVNDNVITSEKVTDGSVFSDFVNTFSSPHLDSYYYVRMIVFSKDIENDPLSVNSLSGDNLRFKELAYKMIPSVLVKGNAYIKNIEVRPNKYGCSQGQLGIRPIMELVSKNNSKFTDEKLDNIISNNLIPYDTYLKSTYL